MEENTLSKILTNILNTNDLYMDLYFTKKGTKKYISYRPNVSCKIKYDILEMLKKFLLKKQDTELVRYSPTRYPNEGQPISLLEAMVNGMLIITTDHAGIPDLVQDGFNGIVSNSDDVSVYKIMKFLMNIENSDFLKYIKNGRATALNDYSERQYIDNIRKLFKII